MLSCFLLRLLCFFFQAEDGIRDYKVTGVRRVLFRSSGPAAGGASGTVDSVSKSSFTISTAAGQKVTVKKASSTAYRKGTSSISASAIKKGERSEERRVGKERRSRWAACHAKKKRNTN